MNTLADLQQTFQQCVLKPDETATTSRISWISASGRADPETQLSIYTHAYTARLKEVLANDYPAILMAIGEDDFEQLTHNYIKVHPSHFFSLRDFGSSFPEYLSELIHQQQQSEIQWQEKPWLYELALFEWTLGEAFNAADANLFKEEDMASIPPEAWPELKFTLHPSVYRLDLKWNISEMWQILTNDNPEEVNAISDTASPWLIWRQQLVTRFRSMQTDEQIALDKLSEGANFNEICEALCGVMSEENVPMRAATLLKDWINNGLISEVSFG